jgi:hypothetical protein
VCRGEFGKWGLFTGEWRFLGVFDLRVYRRMA